MTPVEDFIRCITRATGVKSRGAWIGGILAVLVGIVAPGTASGSPGVGWSAPDSGPTRERSAGIAAELAGIGESQDAQTLLKRVRGLESQSMSQLSSKSARSILHRHWRQRTAFEKGLIDFGLQLARPSVRRAISDLNRGRLDKAEASTLIEFLRQSKKNPALRTLRREGMALKHDPAALDARLRELGVGPPGAEEGAHFLPKMQRLLSTPPAADFFRSLPPLALGAMLSPRLTLGEIAEPAARSSAGPGIHPLDTSLPPSPFPPGSGVPAPGSCDAAKWELREAEEKNIEERVVFASKKFLVEDLAFWRVGGRTAIGASLHIGRALFGAVAALTGSAVVAGVVAAAAAGVAVYMVYRGAKALYDAKTNVSVAKAKLARCADAHKGSKHGETKPGAKKTGGRKSGGGGSGGGGGGPGSGGGGPGGPGGGGGEGELHWTGKVQYHNSWSEDFHFENGTPGTRSGISDVVWNVDTHTPEGENLGATGRVEYGLPYTGTWEQLVREEGHGSSCEDFADIVEGSGNGGPPPETAYTWPEDTELVVERWFYGQWKLKLWSTPLGDRSYRSEENGNCSGWDSTQSGVPNYTRSSLFDPGETGTARHCGLTEIRLGVDGPLSSDGRMVGEQSSESHDGICSGAVLKWDLTVTCPDGGPAHYVHPEEGTTPYVRCLGH